jgi:hypothetical protein
MKVVEIPTERNTIIDVAGADMGVPQIVDPLHYDTILEALESGRNYLADFVQVDTFYAPVRELCANKNEHCGLWVVLGGKFHSTTIFHQSASESWKKIIADAIKLGLHRM